MTASHAPHLTLAPSPIDAADGSPAELCFGSQRPAGLHRPDPLRVAQLLADADLQPRLLAA
jgi:hypothetical protein